jgi:hypothetical protein
MYAGPSLKIDKGCCAICNEKGRPFLCYKYSSNIRPYFVWYNREMRVFEAQHTRGSSEPSDDYHFCDGHSDMISQEIMKKSNADRLREEPYIKVFHQPGSKYYLCYFENAVDFTPYMSQRYTSA